LLSEFFPVETVDLAIPSHVITNTIPLFTLSLRELLGELIDLVDTVTDSFVIRIPSKLVNVDDASCDVRFIVVS
jgi:hypothetical protein